jgi:hypothetical protein
MNRVVVVMTCILSTAGAAQSPGRDVTFTMKVTTDSGGQSKSITERFLASGLKIRMEISTVPETRAMGGMVTITNGADSTMVSVMPSLQMAMIMRIPGTKVDLTGMPSVSSVTRRDSVDLGPAEAILGYPTRHYRVHSTATMTRTFPDKVCTQVHSGTREMWVTTDTEPGFIIQSVTHSLLSGLGGGVALNGQSLMDIADSIGKGRSKSMALRTVSRDSMTGPDGQMTVKTTTVEYTELSRALVDSMLFEIPAGFQVNDMRSMALPDMSSGMAAVASLAAAKAAGCVPKTAP